LAERQATDLFVVRSSVALKLFCYFITSLFANTGMCSHTPLECTVSALLVHYPAAFLW